MKWQEHWTESTCFCAVLFLHTDVTICIRAYFKDIIAREALFRIDRMSNAYVIALAKCSKGGWSCYGYTCFKCALRGRRGKKKEDLWRAVQNVNYEENRVFLADSEKNLIYEANITNPSTVDVISKNFQNPKDILFIRAKSLHLLICDNLGIGRFCLSSGKVSRPVLTEVQRSLRQIWNCFG